MSLYTKVKYKGKFAKLEVFNKNHKLAISLPVHKYALDVGLHVPKIYEIEDRGREIYKYTEWIEGNTILDEMTSNEDLIEPICNDLGRYVNKLYDFGIAAVDSHFKNFVWCTDGVIYIDMKKLLYRRTEKEHLLQMAKICLKSCRGDKRKALAFLRGYSDYRDVRPIIEECNCRDWKWLSMKGRPLYTEPVILEEI